MLAAWQVWVGTVGFAVCLMALGAWLFCAAASRLDLEDDSDAASDPASRLRLAGTSRVHAGPRLHWERPVALHEVQRDLQTRLADRKREKAEAQIYRICRSVRDGGKYPAA